MWQFHLLCLFTNSHGDLINLGEEKHSKPGCVTPELLLAKKQNPVHLPLVFVRLVFGNFIKGCAKVCGVTVGGAGC